jgi:dihydrofolate reductase
LGTSVRELVVTENITLDGVIDAAEGWFAPSRDGDETNASDVLDVLAVLQQHMQRQAGLLLGRVTFEQFRGYWPQQRDDSTGITAHLNSVSKYVVSRTLQEPAWENTTVLRGPLEEEVERLKREPGGEIGVTGSISVVRSLMAAGVVDEYRLFVYPIVLGRGARLFQDASQVGKLELVECQAFRSGITLMSYRSAGA